MNGLPAADVDADMSVHPYGDAGDVGHRINRAFFGCHIKHGVGAGIPNTVGAVFDLSRVTIADPANESGDRRPAEWDGCGVSGRCQPQEKAVGGVPAPAPRREQ